MRKIQRFVLNAVLLAVVSVGMRTVSVSFNVYVSEKIGSEGMGLLSLVMSIYGISVTFACSGIHLAVMRLIAANGEDLLRVKKIMRACMLYSMFFGVVSAGVLFALSDWLGNFVLNDSRSIPSLRMIAFSLPFLSLGSVFSGYFHGVRRVYKNAFNQVWEQGVKVAVCTMGLLMLAPAGLEYACLAIVGGGSIAELFSFLSAWFLYLWDQKQYLKKHRFCEKNTVSSPITLLQQAKEVVAIAFPTAVSAYARNALVTAEHLAIPWGLKKSGASSHQALSAYGVLQGMVFPVLLFPSAVLGAFSGLLIPEISEYQAKQNKREIQYIIGRVFQISMLFSVGTAGIFLCFSQELGMTLYQSQEACLYIQLLAPLIPVMYLDGAVDSILKGMGEQMHCMKINLLDASLSLILVIFLLPKMGILGYITVIFICELLNAALSIYHLLKVTHFQVHLMQWICKPLLSIMLATALTRWGCSVWGPFFEIQSGWGCMVKIMFAVILYLFFVFLTRSISKEDIRWARKFFQRS